MKATPVMPDDALIRRLLVEGKSAQLVADLTGEPFPYVMRALAALRNEQRTPQGAPMALSGSYSVTTAPAPEPAGVSNGAPTLEQLLAAGDRSSVKRTAALAGKIRGLAVELRAAILEERADSETRRRIAELEAQLDAERAKLRAGKTKSLGELLAGAGDYPCRKGCGRAFSRPQGRGRHEQGCTAA